MKKAVSTENVRSLLMVSPSEPHLKSFAQQQAIKRGQERVLKATRLDARRRNNMIHQFSNQLKRDADQYNANKKSQLRRRTYMEGDQRFVNYMSKPFNFITHQYMPQPASQALREHDIHNQIRHLARGQRLQKVSKASYNILNGQSKNWSKSRVPSQLNNRYQQYYEQAQGQYKFVLPKI